MSDDASSNRRPLKSRGSSWSRFLTAKLVERSVTPNQVSCASVVLAAFGAVMFLGTSLDLPPFARMLCFLLTVVGIQGRLLCNLLDGMLAIESGLRSKVGEIYNDLPDRIADVLLLLAAGVSLGSSRSLFFSGLTLGWFAALVAVSSAYLRLLGAASGTPHYFVGPMAKQHRMALLSAASLLSIGELWAGADYRILALALWIIIVGGLFTCYRRLKLILGFLESKPL